MKDTDADVVFGSGSLSAADSWENTVGEGSLYICTVFA